MIGGFSDFGGTGRPPGTRLDFVLQDILQMRRSTPPTILAAHNLPNVAIEALGDDVQVVMTGTTNVPTGTVIITPGRNGILETPVSEDYFSSEGPRIVAGINGVADTPADGDDVQVLPVGTFPLAPEAVVIAPGANGTLDTVPAEDDSVLGPDGILPGPDGAVQSVAQGDDVQLVPVATTGVSEDVVVITAGQNGVLDTSVRGDDIAAVASGYEVSATCSADTPFAILAGANSTAETLAEDGICTIASPPHFAGESCVSDSGCGLNPNAPTSTVGMDAGSGATMLQLTEATTFPSSGLLTVGAEEVVYTGKSGNTLELSNGLVNDVPVGTAVTLVTARCTGDMQGLAPGEGMSPNDVVVAPGTADFLVSVPSGDDVFVGPGLPCTHDDDCTVGAEAGACTGPQNVVRVEQRRNGQFRRFWALFLPDESQFQTDFDAILVRPGDEIGLVFVQDVDRDGLIAQEEAIHGSSDFKKDTDDDGIGDFSEVRIGWDVGVVGQPLRRVFPDPRRRDSDGDGLTDLEEQDVRVLQCACSAVGPKSFLGSGGLLRGEDPKDGAQACSTDSDCLGEEEGSCLDAVHCSALGTCPPCSSDITLNRTDPRLRDTDVDGVTDTAEVIGYLTGAGIVDPHSLSGESLIVAGTNLRADTVACPQNHCIEDPDQHCTTDADCFSHICIHPVACDEVQVIFPGLGVRNAATVVVVPGPLGGLSSGSASGDDTVVVDGNEVAESLVQGDDQIVVGPGQQVTAGAECVDGGNFDLCSIIKPGPDGQLTSVLNGDDVIIPGGTGQKLEASDPFNPDTDLDLIPDGNERLLGSSPNLPGDAVFGGDQDEDGLTDVAERLGWTVQISDAGGTSNARPVVSNPNLPDTDFDGLPDFAERHLPCATPPTCDAGTPTNMCSNNTSVECTTAADCANECPTDPTNVDTDADGINDFDELSATQLNTLARFSDFFPNFVLDESNSAQYGTDPTRVDTDEDGLSDRNELFVGWNVVRNDGTVQQVFSDPARSDTDGDGLADAAKRTHQTDPRDSDTDDDGRPDGLEVEVGTNPLQPDIFVTVTYSAMQLTGPLDGGEGANDWRWRLSLQDANQRFPGTTLSDDRGDCPGDLQPAACLTSRFNFALNRSTAVTLTPDGGIVLNGLIVEIDDVVNDTQPIDDVAPDNCRMAFIDQPLTYDNLVNGTFMTRTFQLSDGACSALILVEISVNCVGRGQGFCHIGNPCISNLDCESGACSSCNDSGECDGIGQCESVCGNGIRESLPGCTLPTNPFAIPQNCEVCDDGNLNDCGSCFQCSIPALLVPCPTGIGCVDNSDCQSGACGFENTGLCNDGTACVLDTDCQSGVCRFEKTCLPVCGNGITEGPEACDDGNISDCGTCNATCDDFGTGNTCAIGTACNADADCQSGKCENNECVAVCGNGILVERFVSPL